MNNMGRQTDNTAENVIDMKRDKSRSTIDKHILANGRQQLKVELEWER